MRRPTTAHLRRPTTGAVDRLRSRIGIGIGGSPIVRRAARHRLGAWLLAAVAAMGVHRAVSQADERSRAWGRTVEVVVATSDISAGATLDGRTTVQRLPAVAVPRAALTGPTAGRRAGRDVPAGAVLTTFDAGTPGSGPVAARLGQNRSAVRVAVAPAPEVGPGDRVDVVAPDLDPVSGSAVGARVLARSAEVLEVAEGTATLSVDHDDAAALAAGGLSGPLAVVVRP